MKSRILTLILTLFALTLSNAQVDSTAYGDIDIFVIDSYISPEEPFKFSLSFFTSDSVKSKVTILNDGDYIVSEDYTDNHKIEIAVNQSLIKLKVIKYFILVLDKYGKESGSQLYEVEIPGTIIVADQNRSGLLQICCFGGIIFGLPSPTLVLKDGRNYFSLTKEIPLFSFYSSGYNYPSGYIGIDYAHIFNSDRRNFARIGYKQIFQTGIIEYLSAGLNFFTDFSGYNGVSPEFSAGFFKVQNVFTFFARYRFNFQLKTGGRDFHEFSIGLYSNFFSLNL